MEIKEAHQEIKRGKYRPVYVLYGKDRYRMSQFIDELTNELFRSEEQELGVVKFDTAETTLEEIVAEAESPPFFVEQKLVLIRDVVVMAAGGKEKTKVEHHPEKLLAYLENPLPSTIIVFAVHADKLDERRKLVKSIKQRKSMIAFPELNGSELKQWMMRRVTEQQRHLSMEAADLLHLRVGVNMGQLAQELEKLCLHVGEGGKIDTEQVLLLTASTVEEDVFAMVDALAELKIDKALHQYHQLLIRREEPIKIAALIARQLRILLQVKELEYAQVAPQQMAGQLGLHPYVVKLTLEKSRRFETRVLGERLAKLAELDYQMKSGLIEKSLGLELYILSFGKEHVVS